MPSYSGIWTLSQQFQGRGQGLWPTPPGAPTIGTATLVTTTSATVAFTAPACTGIPAGVTGYQAISTPGCLTATGASSPVTVTGLTAGTAYTFNVRALGASGYGAYSGSSNSVQAAVPGAPTIGTATAGNANASVTFTAPVDRGSPATITGYTVTSTPGGITGTGSSSPVTVSGLTNCTAYTFKVKAQNAYGFGACSASSNSVTPVFPTCATYTTPGTYSWVAPAGVTSVAAVAVGGGGAGNIGSSYFYYCCCIPVFVRCSGAGGAGGALAYRNAVSVTPGTSYTVVVGTASGSSSVFSMTAGGGSAATGPYSPGVGGVPSGTRTAGFSGGAGQAGRCSVSIYSCTGVYFGGGGAGGAAGYSGGGGAGGNYNAAGSAGSGGSAGGGAGGGGPSPSYSGGGGGGVGIFGQGSDGAGGSFPAGGGGGGSGGAGGSGPNGGLYGGGGGGGTYGGGGGCVGRGAVRIIWAGGSRGTPSFPSTNVGP